jgi:hypothetical protein
MATFIHRIAFRSSAKKHLSHTECSTFSSCAKQHLSFAIIPLKIAFLKCTDTVGVCVFSRRYTESYPLQCKRGLHLSVPFRNAIFSGNIATERCCLALLEFVAKSCNFH